MYEILNAMRTRRSIRKFKPKYGKQAFHIEESYINVVIPFDAAVLKQIKRNVAIQDFPDLRKTQKAVLSLLLEDNSQNKVTMANRLGVSVRTIERALADLQKANLIIRSGSKRDGKWVVIKTE